MENTSATLLYVQACKFLLCGEDKSSWNQLMAILPQLRQALTCRVCRGLIVDPFSSKYCQHYVCRACLKRKRALNPGCKWCLDWSKLEESDGQIHVLLACYKMLCEAIKSSSYYVNGDKNLAIDNLLMEAKFNPGVSSKSGLTVSNNIGILDSQPNMAEKSAEVVSRDEVKTCARENVTNNVNTTNGGKLNFGANKVPETTTNGIPENSDEKSQHCETVIVEGKNEQLPPEVVNIETANNINLNETNMKCNGTSTHCETANEIHTDSDIKEDPNLFNNSNSEIQTPLVRKVKSKNLRSCLRPRNGQLVQKFEAGRYMRKRKFLQANKIIRKSKAQTLRRPIHQRDRPSKRYRIESTK